MLLAANLALNAALVLLSHRRHVLCKSVVRSPSIRLHHQSDCADQLRNPCSETLRRLAVSNTTTALLACLSRRKPCASLYPSLRLGRKPARCVHRSTHHRRPHHKTACPAPALSHQHAGLSDATRLRMRLFLFLDRGYELIAEHEGCPWLVSGTVSLDGEEKIEGGRGSSRGIQT
jgi:hypothetical protein